MYIKKRKFQGDGWRLRKKETEKDKKKSQFLQSPYLSRLKTTIHAVQNYIWADSNNNLLMVMSNGCTLASEP